MKFVKNTKYYSGIVYEWNLPTGWTCPFANECLVKVDRDTGKFQNKSKLYKCYAANAERFPAVRNHRWNNLEYVKSGKVPELPINCSAIRIHASGDFFSQSYFDVWLDIAKKHPDVEFWAYTKSINYWVNSINKVPANLELTASYGGKHDNLISLHNLKNVKVYKNKNEVPANISVDTNDDLARNKNVKEFALIDNFIKKENNSIKLIL
jgi:hypothetical protein